MLFLETMLAIRLYNNYYHESFFTFIITSLLWLVNIGAFLIILLVDVRRFFREQRFTAFGPSIISLLAGILLTIPAAYINTKRYSPITLYCTNFPTDSHELAINFRENGTYEIITQGLGAVFSRGNYRRQGNVIEMEKNFMDTLIVSRRLLNDNNITIHQVDEQNHRVPGSADFLVKAPPNAK